MPVDIAKLMDELGATGEERSAVEGFLSKNSQAAEKLHGWRENGLRQSDYDRKMNLLKAETDAEKTRLQQAEQTLVANRDTMNSQYLKALEDKEKAEVALSTLRAKANRVASEYNVPATEFDLGAAPANPNPANPAAPRTDDNPQYVKREDFEQVVDLLKKAPMLPVEVNKLQREHYELTGQYFDENALVEKALELRKPIGQVADLMFGLSTKRAEKHDAEIRADQKAKDDAEWKTKVSQNQVTPIRADAQPQASPVFALKTPENFTKPGPRPDRMQSGVDAAVQAFRQGKYSEAAKTA